MDKGSSSSNSYKRSNDSATSVINNSSQLSQSTNVNKSNTAKSSFSPQALIHSNKGEYVRNGKRHLKGGHGQDSIDYMDQNGIKYEINIEYKNGVRVGNIPDSKQRTARSGNNHSWFPKEWNSKMIAEAANYVAKHVKNPIDGHQYSKLYNGIRTTIIFNNKEIYSAFPNKRQSGGRKND